MERLTHITSVQELSPLGSDIVTKLPELNRNSNRVDLLSYSLSSIEGKEFTSLSLPEAQAMQRDLGFLVASLAKHSFETEEMSPVIDALKQVSLVTNEVPRDTVYSYTLRNPKGANMRTFTGSEQERVFIEATGNAARETEQVIGALAIAQELDANSQEFQDSIQSGIGGMQEMITAIVSARRSVSPEFFTNELRPYFPPIEIDGKIYYAPGGAQLPILLIDQVVWGADIQDERYGRYLEDNLQYLPPELRQLSRNIGSRESLVNKVLAKVTSGEDGSRVQEATQAIAGLLDITISFRYPHLKVAEANMGIRSEGSLGSGGYDLEILRQLINHTQEAREKLRRVIK